MRAAAQKSRSGELLDARYELRELLESSATYDTYRATDRKTSRTVEVQLLRAELALQSKVVQGFVGGPKTLTGLRHPNVSQVLAVDTDETGIPFIVQEHVEGELLSRVLAGFPDGMPLGVAVNMISPVVEAIAAAHELGLVHGELDREHVLLTKQGGSSVPKVVRFLGRAGQTRPVEGGALRAPELRSGKASADARSDVWAIGALLYETLSGAAPEPTERSGVHSPLDERAPHLSTDLVELVERCLASDPAKRPARANEVQVALSAVTERLRAGSRSTPEPKQAALPPSRPMRPPAVPARPVGRGTAVARKVALPSLGDASADPSLDAAFAATFEGDPPQVQDQGRSAAAKRLEIGLGATIAMAKSPIASVIPLPIAEAPIAEPEVDLLLPADDEPEIVLESVSPSLAPRLAAAAKAGRRSAPPEVPAPAEVKTLSDLVLAFAPIEGEDHVGQAEVAGAARARAFRKSMHSEQSPGAKDGALAETVDESRTSKKAEREKTGAPLGSPKQLRQANAQTRPLSEEQVRQLRESTQQGERRRSRAVGLLLFFLFLFALLFAVPLLWDPTRVKAQELLGARTKVAVAALAILAVIALVRTWSIQLQLHPFMLRPVTTTLRVVTTCVCVLSATYFLPNGALGPAESAARFALPWAAGAFYLFFGIYGMLQAIRTASSNAVQGLALALLCSGGFFGSYRAIATTVLARQRAAHGSGVGVHFGGVRGLMGQMKKYASGKVEQPDAGAEEQMVEQHHLGGSEAEDMRGVEQLQNARKRKGNDLQKLGDKIHEVAR